MVAANTVHKTDHMKHCDSQSTKYILQLSYIPLFCLIIWEVFNKRQECIHSIDAVILEVEENKVY